MPSFPTFTYKASLDSEETLRDDLQIDRATNGSIRARAFWTAPKRDFVWRLPVMSTAERATLESFYTTNRKIAITFTWDGDGNNYTCLMTAPPKFKRLFGGRWSAEVPLTQT